MHSPGKFTPYRDVSCKDLGIFYEATKDLRGATYKPYLVSTRERRGIDFRFICNSTIMTRPPENAITRVSVFLPFCKDPEKEKVRAFVTGICRMDCCRS